MAIISESPWYQQILKEGEQRGIQQGIREGEQRGIQQGIQQGILLSIETSLELKFGVQGLQLLPAIAQISDLERLKAIQREVITANTLEQLQQII